MTENLASDPLVVTVELLKEAGPVLAVFPSGPCAYCREPIQMVNGSFRNLCNGELHTCPRYVARELGRRYVKGDFQWEGP